MKGVSPFVRDAWLNYNEPFEGRCNFMYLDIKRLVTCGVGNYLPTISAAQALPWLRSDMSRASPGEIAAAWLIVKNDQIFNPLNGGGQYKKLTTLRLSEQAVNELVMRRLDEMGAELQRQHPFFYDLPADAQLACLSMAWAAGPDSPFPKFWAAMAQGDYMTAANECSLKGVGTVVKRNLANKLCLINADRARAHGMAPENLYWPKVLPPPQAH